MIVDCHTHINFAVDDEVAASEHLEAAETVDACIVLARAGESNEEVNKKLAEYVGRHKEKMVGFAVVEPTKDNVSVKNLTSIKDRLLQHILIKLKAMLKISFVRSFKIQNIKC